MTKFINITSTLLLLSNIIFAQTKNYTTDDIMTNRNLYPVSEYNNLQWQPNSDCYSFINKNAIISKNVNNNNADTIINLIFLNSLLDSVNYFKSLSSYQWIDNKLILMTNKNNYYHLNTITKNIELINKLPANANNVYLAPNNKLLAFTIKNNLYYSVNGAAMQITTDADTNIVNGHIVHRNEFGIDKGIFWSPKANYIAFYKMDEGMVTNYPLVDVNNRIATLDNIKYPMAGMSSHQVKLCVYDIKNNKSITLNTDNNGDKYLTNIAWSPDEKTIYIAELNRNQNHLQLNCYNAQTGAFVKMLFEEKNDKYVEPQNPIEFMPNNNNQFLWLSQRDGFNHIYLYDSAGKLIKQITKGNWIVNEIIGFSNDNAKIFFTSSMVSPIEKHLFSVNIKTGKITQLTKDKGTHSILKSENSKYFITKYSNLNTPQCIKSFDQNGKILCEIENAENPLKEYKLGETTIFNIYSNDSILLYCRMIKPVNFDANKKYPVIVYVYGGPHAQLVTESWLGGANLYLNHLAQLGYIVFTLDNRGSANRGFNFESSIFRNLGTIEIEDQLKGIEYLKSLNYVDTERIAVDGWSYGGFMAISLKLKHPKLFKVATAGGPVIDWKLYEIMYGERYMDKPEQNPQGYKNACLLNYTDNLEGKLLIIHDAMDNTVVWQHTLQFLNACIKSKKQVDYFVFPNHEHNVRGVDRAYLFNKLINYYKDNL